MNFYNREFETTEFDNAQEDMEEAQGNKTYKDENI